MQLVQPDISDWQPENQSYAGNQIDIQGAPGR
jgi:hypothetical protein